MSKNGNTSSSSDDENLIDAFKEACDQDFLPQSLFTVKHTTISEDSGVEKEIKPSCRITERSDNFSSFGVSQSFKDYVAKKLDVLLDRSIDDRDDCEDDMLHGKRKKKKNKKLPKTDTGIKLLSSSDKVITKIEENEKQGKITKPWKLERENESTSIAKCREAAVDPDWILSKTETKAWNERQKGVVFKYKRGCDGALIEDR